ncbi:MAG: CRISPR-associated protein Cas5 [Tepidanaerobacteraceae bacterium]|nr:CRISPR-associated protein Cas5 [Tepidanaerobacteraceae bacterium]
MKAVSFDIKGKLAHFRRPDTTTTQLTYPFITPTAAKGLVGAILGIEDFVTSDKIGIQLLSPVRTVAQQLSMLGKDSGSAFNRPTTIEILVNPAYRIFYVGREYVDLLIEFLQADHAVYPTYLGSAYALTKPITRKIYNKVQILENNETQITTKTVIPTEIIKELCLEHCRQYMRAGGFMYAYKGERTFEKSVDFIYEGEGKNVSFIPKTEISSLVIQLVLLGDETVCLI